MIEGWGFSSMPARTDPGGFFFESDKTDVNEIRQQARMP
jgi:hypothetical protein